MKNYILTLVVALFAMTSFAQKSIDGIMGIKFGSSMDVVTSAIKLKGGTSKKSTVENALSFNDVFFGGRKTLDITFKFVNGKFYQALVFFTADKEPQTLDLHQKILDDLKSVYGQSIATREFKSPYKEGDGDEIMALKGGYATIRDSWIDGDNAISLKATDSMLIMLIYEDGKLFDEAKAKKNPLKDY